MKKIIILLAAALVLSACGNSNTAAPGTSSTVPSISLPLPGTNNATSTSGAMSSQEWLNKYGEIVQKIKKAKVSENAQDAMEVLALMPQLQKMANESMEMALKMSPEERTKFEEQLNKLSDELK